MKILNTIGRTRFTRQEMLPLPAPPVVGPPPPGQVRHTVILSYFSPRAAFAVWPLPAPPVVGPLPPGQVRRTLRQCVPPASPTLPGGARKDASVSRYFLLGGYCLRELERTRGSSKRWAGAVHLRMRAAREKWRVPRNRSYDPTAQSPQNRI
eukprot:1184447-Prorocentrum_minimum.AAC.4